MARHVSIAVAKGTSPGIVHARAKARRTAKEKTAEASQRQAKQREKAREGQQQVAGIAKAPTTPPTAPKKEETHQGSSPSARLTETPEEILVRHECCVH